jgi:hypothetical protein
LFGCLIKRGNEKVKKYLLLIEDEKLWEKFKETIDKDINSEIMELIKIKIGGKKSEK